MAGLRGSEGVEYLNTCSAAYVQDRSKYNSLLSHQCEQGYTLAWALSQPGVIIGDCGVESTSDKPKGHRAGQ